MEPDKWRASVLSFVVDERKNRSSEHRSKAQSYLDEVSSWVKAETLRDVVMLDEEEFQAHHMYWKQWTPAKCQAWRAQSCILPHSQPDPLSP